MKRGYLDNSQRRDSIAGRILPREVSSIKRNSRSRAGLAFKIENRVQAMKRVFKAKKKKRFLNSESSFMWL